MPCYNQPIADEIHNIFTPNDKIYQTIISL